MSTNDLQKEAVKQFKEKELHGKVVRSMRAVECVVDEDGKTKYYKIKATAQGMNDSYFGAIPFSAWKIADEHPNDFFFVIAVFSSEFNSFDFETYTPNEFVSYVSSFSFSTYFDIDLKHKKNKKKNAKKLSDIMKIINEINKLKK